MKFLDISQIHPGYDQRVFEDYRDGILGHLTLPSAIGFNFNSSSEKPPTENHTYALRF
jgi:hypothetical protein